MGDNHLAEAILRVEYKLDLILKALGLGNIPPMHFIGQMCPACGKPIDYQLDVVDSIVIRRCGCKTGKIPATIPLLPVQGTGNGQATPGSTQAALGPAPSGEYQLGPKDGDRRKGR